MIQKMAQQNAADHVAVFVWSLEGGGVRWPPRRCGDGVGAFLHGVGLAIGGNDVA